MARGTLALQEVDRDVASAAITWTAADGTNKHKFLNTGGKCLLLIRNTHTGPHIVTLDRPKAIDGADTLADLSITVVNGTDAVIGPFPDLYNQVGADLGYVFVDPPATPTALSFAVLKVV